MKPSLEKKAIDLIRRLDDCFALNGQAVNLRGLIANQKKLRTVRNSIDHSDGAGKNAPSVGGLASR